MRKFKFDPGRGWKPGEEIILPANLTPLPLPFNWHWQQNPHVNQVLDPVTGETRLVNVSKLVRLQVEYLPHYMETIPQKAHQEPPDDEELLEIIAKLEELYHERPIWTRRALINRVNHTLTEATLHLIRLALPYVGYRFKDGPFRDAIIKFGLDPRKDPKYRMYQTIYFQLAERDVKDPGAPWNGMRQSTTSKKLKKPNDKLSHFFNGRDVAIDGKIWQMCDVTDPLLARLIKEAPIRETFEQKNDGWFCNGTLAKIRAIMKVKIVALHTEKEIKDEDFKKALEMPDIIPERQQKQIWIPVPDIKLTKEEMEKLRADGKDFTVMSGMVKKKRAYVGRLRRSRRNLDDAPEWSPGLRGLPGLQQKKASNVATEKQKSGSAGAESADESRRPSTVESIDPRLLADQVEGVNLGADGDVDMGEYDGYDDDEMGDSDMYSDLSQGSDWDENSEMEGFSRAYGDRDHSHDDEGREGEGERHIGASDAESINMVQYQDQDSPSQLAQSIEGPDKN
jgi:general transcription factor 3C polypeptide 5 (transcription factor C subunit 1)